MQSTGSPESRLEKWKPYRWPAVVLALGLMAVITVLTVAWMSRRAYESTLVRAGQAGEATLAKASAIAERFMNGRITQTFVASLPELVPLGYGNLELTTLKEVETFRLEDERSVFWDTLSLGRTTSEIRVPVTYRYHLRLSDPWQLEVSGQSCRVRAPRIRASLPPAVHTHNVEKRSDEGWGRFNAHAQMDALERSMTPTLSIYAGSPKRLQLVRESCRKTVAEFVRHWLLREDHWRDDRFRSITVIFDDEVEERQSTEGPTVLLK